MGKEGEKMVKKKSDIARLGQKNGRLHRGLAPQKSADECPPPPTPWCYATGSRTAACGYRISKITRG